MARQYTFEVVITEGSDELWEELEGSGCNEIERVLRETIEIEFRDNLTDITLVSYYAGERR